MTSQQPVKFFFASSEIDQEGVIEPDMDEPQEMGEIDSTEVKKTLKTTKKYTADKSIYTKCMSLGVGGEDEPGQ